MEKVRVINRQKTSSIKKSKTNILSLAVANIHVSVSLGVFLFLGIASTLDYAFLYMQASSNAYYQKELSHLSQEVATLEERKANLLNIRELQLKAENLGFEYNESINYIK